MYAILHWSNAEDLHLILSVEMLWMILFLTLLLSDKSGQIHMNVLENI